MLWRLKDFQLRRPFSRQINLTSAALTTDDGRRAFLRRYGDLAEKSPLASALLTALYAYDGDPAQARAMLELIAAKGFTAPLQRLNREADLRKYLLSCLQSWFREHGALPRETAAILRTLAERTDASYAAINRPAEPPPDDHALTRFDYARSVPDGLTIHTYVRTYYYGPGSRPHDLGPRFQTAFERGGAHSRSLEPTHPNDDLPACDIALVDDTYFFAKSSEDKRRFLENLRRKARKMLMVEFDPWAAGLHDRAAANGDLYDGVWLMAPSLIDRDTMTICGLPATIMPFPVGAGAIFDRHALRDDELTGLPHLRFVGGVEPYNYFRYFWVLAASALDSAPAFKVTTHGADGLSALDSLDAYVGALRGSYGGLNFLMRDGGRSTVVGRTSDSLRLGQLLVQEYCADTHAYLTPGTHYLEFTNINELAAIAETFGNGPSPALEDVRRSGHAFFMERYSDEAVTRHLTTILDG